MMGRYDQQMAAGKVTAALSPSELTVARAYPAQVAPESAGRAARLTSAFVAVLNEPESDTAADPQCPG
jgi:hypothetical protein